MEATKISEPKPLRGCYSIVGCDVTVDALVSVCSTTTDLRVGVQLFSPDHTPLLGGDTERTKERGAIAREMNKSNFIPTHKPHEWVFTTWSLARSA